MGEYGSRPEIQKPSVLSGEYTDILDPKAYIKVAEQGAKNLRKLFSSVER